MLILLNISQVKSKYWDMAMDDKFIFFKKFYVFKYIEKYFLYFLRVNEGRGLINPPLLIWALQRKSKIM